MFVSWFVLFVLLCYSFLFVISQEKVELRQGGLAFILWSDHHSKAADGVRGNMLLYLNSSGSAHEIYFHCELAKFSIFHVNTQSKAWQFIVNLFLRM